MALPPLDLNERPLTYAGAMAFSPRTRIPFFHHYSHEFDAWFMQVVTKSTLLFHYDHNILQN